MSLPLITVIGSLNADLTSKTSRMPAAGETLTAQSFTVGFGGKGANQATACAKLSRHQDDLKNCDLIVKMVGMVGTDSYGEAMKEPMMQNGIDVSEVWRKEGSATGIAIIIVEESTGESRILVSPNANACVEPTLLKTIPGPVPDLIVLQLEIPLPTVLQILQVANDEAIPVILNPAPAVAMPKEVFKGITHLILNETEVEILTQAALAEEKSESSSISYQSPAPSTSVRVANLTRIAPSPPAQEDDSPNLDKLTQKAQVFHALGVQVVIITLGAKGVFASFEGSKVRFPAEKATVVDASGAGDTFVGAYAVAIVRYRTERFSKGQILSAVKWANHCASKAVEQLGAQSSMPWAHQVRPFQLEDLT